MISITSILIFLGVLFVLILVHEWGHYIVAKRTGMRVDEFAIGFPPRLWSWTKGETTYSLNAIPLGGYVKIYGEDSTIDDQVIATGRAFSDRPRYAQAMVLVAGVVMNVVLAWVLLVAVNIIGVQAPVPDGEVSDTATLVVSRVLPGSPAEILPLGVTITEVRDASDRVLSPLTPQGLSEFIASSDEASYPISISYRQGAVNETVSLVPIIGLDPDAPERLLLGLSSAYIDTIRYGVIESVVKATTETWLLLMRITEGIIGLLTGVVKGTANLEDVAGPVGIVSYIGEAASFGFVSLLFFTAVISLNLAVINLLPIPALDGGRLVIVAIESVIRKPLSPLWVGRAHATGFILLILLMIVVTINDIGRFF